MEERRQEKHVKADQNFLQKQPKVLAFTQVEVITCISDTFVPNAMVV
jgi:hypothetical protein